MSFAGRSFLPFGTGLLRRPVVLALGVTAGLLSVMVLIQPAFGFQIAVAIDGPTKFAVGNGVPFTVDLTLTDAEVLEATVTADLTGPAGFSRTVVGIPIGPDGVVFGPILSTPTADTSIGGKATHQDIFSGFSGIGYAYGYQSTTSSGKITLAGKLNLPATAPAGTYTLKFTVNNGAGPGSPQSAEVTLTVVGSRVTTLPVGWSTFSIPIGAQNGKFFVDATATLDKSTQDGLVDPTKVTIAYKFDAAAATPTFDQIVLGTSTNTLTPTEAVLVKASVSVDATLIFQTAQTGPPSRTLSKGWNLVGLAVPEDTTTKQVDLALISAKETSAGLTGYTIVVSPSINPDSFVWTKAESATGVDLTISRGYWVFMENQDVLAGFSTTPVKP